MPDDSGGGWHTGREPSVFSGVVSSDDAALESTLGLGGPHLEDGDALVSDRDRVAAALFARPVEQTRVGRYVVERELGSGAMGIVYEGRDEDLDRTVALKVIRTSSWDGEDAIGRFRREAQALARLSHPNVVTIHEIGEHEDRHFIAMELVRGRTLRQWIHDEKPDWRAVIDVFVQAGRGLAAAHSAELVHRDFKPANCIVGDDGRARVRDCGLARGLAIRDDEAAQTHPSTKILEATLTATGAVLGTPAYMAPEQLSGKAVDAGSDQFAFCVAMYEAMVGIRPFTGSSAHALHDSIKEGVLREPEEPPRSPPPAALRSLIVRGFAFDRSVRWPDMASLLDALERYPVQRRRRRTLAVGAVAGTLAIGGVAFAQREDPCLAVSQLETPGWSPERQGSIRDAILSSSERSQRVWITFDAAADNWANRWSQARVDACEEALVHGRTTPGIYDRQAECLDGRADTFSTYLKELSRDGSAWRHALDFAAAFPTLEGCTNPTRIVATEPPSPAIAERVAEARELIDQSHAKHLSGDVEAALTAARSANEVVKDVSYPRVSARAQLQLGSLKRLASGKLAEPLLLAALRDAELARADELSAEVATELLLLAITGRNVSAATGWEALASAKLARADASPAERAELAIASTELAIMREDPEAADRFSAEAIELFEQADRRDGIQVARALANRALALEWSGERDAALDAHDANVRAHEAALGPHPATANALFFRARFRSEIGQGEDALGDYRQALDILEGARGVERLLANTRMGLLWQQSMSGDLELADVDRAIAPLRDLPADDPEHASAMEWRAAVLQRVGKTELALAEYDRLLVRLESSGDHPPQDLAMLRSNAAECELALGRFDAAHRRFTAALSELSVILDPMDPRLAYALVGLGSVELERDRPEAARLHFERAMKVLEDGWGDTLLMANLNWGLARSLPADAANAKRANAAAEEAGKLFGELGDEGRDSLTAVQKWLNAAR